MFKYLKRYKLKSLISVFLTFLMALFFGYSLFVVMFMLDSILESQIGLLLIWSFSSAVGATLALLLNIYIEYYNEKITQSIFLDMKIELLNKLNLLTYQDIQDKKLDYQSLFLNDINLIENNCFSIMSNFIYNFFLIIISICFMFYFSYIIGLIVIAMIVIYSTLPLTINKWIKNNTEKFNKKEVSYSDKTLKILESIDTLFFANKIDLIKNKLIKKENQKIYQANIKYVSVMGFKTFLFSSVLFTFDTLLVLISAVLLTNNLLNTHSTSLGIGMILSVVTLSSNIFSSSKRFFDNLSQIQSTKPIFNKWEALNKINLIQTNLVNNINEIKLENVSLTIDKKQIIKNFNLVINKNCKYLISGRSGIGKSTIAMIISNLIKPTSGSVYYNNLTTKDFESQKNILSKIIYVQPTPYIFEDTIKNNITLYDKNLNQNKYNNIVELLNLKDLDDSKIIDSKDFDLSTGQKQRINIARSLYRECKFLIFDEAMSNIDNVTAKKIEKHLLNQKDLTFINISHHINDESKNLYNKTISL